MNIATYQTTPEKHGEGTFFFTDCGHNMYSIWHIMVACVLVVCGEGYIQHCILEVQRKRISIGMRNGRKEKWK